MLKNGGSFAVKIFQGGGEQDLRAKMQSLFGKVAQVKPAATRKESFEVYLVGVGFTGDDARGDLDTPG
jgi:23S rRNA (uridine2552-2'-O)-methyltransferase